MKFNLIWISKGNLTLRYVVKKILYAYTNVDRRIMFACVYICNDNSTSKIKLMLSISWNRITNIQTSFISELSKKWRKKIHLAYSDCLFIKVGNSSADLEIAKRKKQRERMSQVWKGKRKEGQKILIQKPPSNWRAHKKNCFVFACLTMKRRIFLTRFSIECRKNGRFKKGKLPNTPLLHYDVKKR